jgi:hypothetical protein
MRLLPLPMPVKLPFSGVFVASAVTLACCAGLLTLLKSVLRSECSVPGGSNLCPVAIACVVAAALCLVASAAYFGKSQAWVWTQAAAMCSKWQPVYFVIVSVQRLILDVIATNVKKVSAGSGHTCSCSETDNVVHAVSLMWSCAVLMAALATMCGDTEAQLPPALRRCAYGVLALVLLLDAIGSVVWGNLLASNASFYLTHNFSVLLGNQLTSSIASQVVLALHFLYVSCRSVRGRGWAYASLRFELDECGKSMFLTTVPVTTSSHKDSGAMTPMLAASAPAEPKHSGAARWNAISRLRRRWLQFQQRQVLLCRVFVVPCVAMRGAGEGDEPVFALARPAFDLRWLRPLQRIADAHPRYYAGFGFFCLAIPAIACAIFLKGLAQGMSNLVLDFSMCIMFLGFLSCKRYGIDRVAARHIALSFRFVIFVTLFAAEFVLNIREVYTIELHPTNVVASIFAKLMLCLSILLDCSPHLLPSVQIFISVRACTHAMLRLRELVC